MFSTEHKGYFGMTWMQTLKGTPFSLVDPDPEKVDFTEIAHALSHLCRYAGHTREFYSVAEHSCRVADILPQPLKLYGLLHDAHEAFIGDITTPVKHALSYDARADIGGLAKLLDFAIFSAAGLDPDPDQSIRDAVKYADETLLMTERRDLLAPPQKPWGKFETILPLAGRIFAWDPREARRQWLWQFQELSAENILAKVN
jgi:hypothetical protein